MWKMLLGIALAGAAGTLARYGLSTFIDRRFGHPFFGTLAANALGCLLFGLVFAWATARLAPEHPARLILLTGFMGAFTTFSTYAYLSHELASKQQWVNAAGHLAAHHVLGIGLLMVGMAIGARLA